MIKIFVKNSKLYELLHSQRGMSTYGLLLYLALGTAVIATTVAVINSVDDSGSDTNSHVHIIDKKSRVLTPKVQEQLDDEVFDNSYEENSFNEIVQKSLEKNNAPNSNQFQASSSSYVLNQNSMTKKSIKKNSNIKNPETLLRGSKNIPIVSDLGNAPAVSNKKKSNTGGAYVEEQSLVSTTGQRAILAGEALQVIDDSDIDNTLVDGRDQLAELMTNVFVEQSKSEALGNCTFEEQVDPSNSSEAIFKVTFDKELSPESFDASDVDLIGIIKSEEVDISLSNCGDDKNFLLRISSIKKSGSVIPIIEKNSIRLKSGGQNNLSESVDNFVLIDKDEPRVTITKSILENIGDCSFVNNRSPTNKVPIAYKVTFSEVVNPQSFTDEDISQEGSAGVQSWKVTSCGDNINFKIEATSILSDGDVIPNIKALGVRDLAGNKNILNADSSLLGIIYDTTAPKISLEQSVLETIGECQFTSQSDPTGTSPLIFKVSSNEAIDESSFDVTDIIQDGTSTDVLWRISSCGDRQNFMLEATSIATDGSVEPIVGELKVADIAGNLNTTVSLSVDNYVKYDITPATVVIEQSVNESVLACNFSSQADPTNSDEIEYKITFSEPIDISTFDVSDITNAGTGGSTLNYTLVNCGDDTNFSLTTNSVTGNGTIIPRIGIGSFEDKYSNVNSQASISTDNSVTYDNTSPNVVINQSIDEVVGVCNFSFQADPTNSLPIEYKVTFNEDIDTSSFDVNDIAVSGSASGITWAINSCGDFRNFSLKATSVSSPGDVVPTLSVGTVTDIAGNLNNASTSTDNKITYDIKPPTISIEQSVVETVGECDFSNVLDPTSILPIEFKITFSEKINTSTFSTSDIAQEGSAGVSAWSLTNCGDDINFSLKAVSISSDGDVIPSIEALKVEDVAGSLNSDASVSSDNSVLYDSTSANVTIEQSINEVVGSCNFEETVDPVNSLPLNYKISFSEPIDTSTFDISDINNSGSGGSSSLIWNLTNCGDDTNFLLRATGISGDGTIIPNILESKYDDRYGNSNISPSTSVDNAITYDSLKPSLTIEQAVNEVVGLCNFNIQSDPSSNTPIEFRLTFDEEINLSTLSIDDIVQSGSANVSAWEITDCGDAQNFSLKATSIESDGTVEPIVLLDTVTDIAGNGNNPSTSLDNSVEYDTLNPTATVEQSVSESIGNCNFSSQNEITGALPIEFKVTFSEAIRSSSFISSDITQSGSAVVDNWSITNCGDDTNFSLKATSISSDGSVIPSLAISTFVDRASLSNTNASTSTDNVVTYDDTPPTLVINQAISEVVGSCSFSSQADPINIAPIEYRATFSERISPASFTAADIDNLGTGGSSGITWNITNCGDDINFSIKATSVSSDGTIIPSVASGKYSDPYVNINTSASTSTDNSVTYETVKPDVSINQSITESIGSCNFTNQIDPTSITPLEYRVTFSEKMNISSFSENDINQIGTGVVDTWEITDCGDNINFSLKATALSGDGTIIPTLAVDSVLDIAGNGNNISSATDNSIVYDTTRPTAAIEQSINESIGSCSFSAQNDVTGFLPIEFKVTFSEPIIPSSFEITDISQNGTASVDAWIITNCGDDINFSLKASSINNDGTVIPTLDVGTFLDTAYGANSSASTSVDNIVTYDNTPPTLVINQANGETIENCIFTTQADPINSLPLEFKATFSERISLPSFNPSDIDNLGTGGSDLLTWTITNCGDDTNFSIKATALSGEGTIIPSVASSKYSDPYTNVNNSLSSSTDNSVTYDSIKPSLTINQSVYETIGSCSFSAQEDPVDTLPVEFRITISEEIDLSTFTTSDVSNSGSATVDNWSITNCGDNKNFSVKANVVSENGYIDASVLADLFADPAGNLNTTSTSVDNSVLYSSNPYTWLGSAGDGLWNNPLNWLGQAVPGSNDIALFPSFCSSCDVTVPLTSIGGIQTTSGYIGTITLSGNLDIGSHGLNHAGGTIIFSNYNIVVNGDLIISTGHLDAGTSLLKFKGHSKNINTSNARFHDFEFEFGSTGFDRSNNITGTVYVDGNFTLDTNVDSAHDSLKGGVIEISGDINLLNWNSFGTTTKLKVVGLANQRLTRLSGSIYDFEIAKSGGVFTFENGEHHFSANFIYTSGNVDFGSSLINFGGYNGTIKTGSLELYDVKFSFGRGDSEDTNKTILGTLVVKNNLLMNTRSDGSARENIQDGTIAVWGDVIIDHWNQFDFNPDGKIRFVGTEDQYILGSAVTKSFPNLIVDKPSGTLYFGANSISIEEAITHINGDVDTGTSFVRIGGYNATLTPGPIEFYDLSFNWGSPGSANSTKVLVGTLKIKNDLTFNTRTSNTANEIISGGSIEVLGNVTVVNIDGFSSGTSLSFTGTTDQIITHTSGPLPGNITVNKPSGKIIQASDLNLSGSGQDLRLQSGDWDMADFDLTINDALTIDTSNTLYKGCGTLTVGGATTNNGAIYGCLPAAPAVITGLTGNGDNDVDNLLAAGPGESIGTISWIDSQDEFSYELTIYESDGVTVKCPMVTLAQDTNTYTYPSCTFTQGKSYIIDLQGYDYLGTKIAASNNMFEFYYAPDATIDDVAGIENVGSLDFTVSLNVAAEYDVSIDYNTVDNTALSSGVFNDFVATSGTLIISAGDTTGTISVPIIDGVYDEPDVQDFSMSLVSADFANIIDDTGLASITDDDEEPSISVADANAREASGPITFSATLSLISEKDIHFNWSTSDVTASESTDYTGVSGGPVTISGGESSVDVEVPLIDNTMTCQNERTFSFSLDTFVNVTAGTVSSTGEILEDDFPSISINNFSGVEGSNFLFSVSLSEVCPTQDIDINYNVVGLTATSGVDFNASSGSFKIKKGEVTNTLTVQTLDDSQTELTETFNVIASGTAGSAGDVVPGSGQGVITDNDSGTPKVTKVAPGINHTCVLFGDGNVKCWGSMRYGLLLRSDFRYGDDTNEVGDGTPAISLGTGIYPKSIALGEYSACAILSDNTMKCWGRGGYYSLQNKDFGVHPNEMGDNLPKADLGNDSNFPIKVVSSLNHSCVIFNDGRLKCFGENGNGQLGQGNTTDLGSNLVTRGNSLPYVDVGSDRTVKDVVLMESATCAHLDNDLVKCWGAGANGRTGHESTATIGNESGEMGDNLDYVDLGVGRTVKKLASAYSTMCAILDNDLVKCWGSGYRGRSGQGHTNDIGTTLGDMGDNLPYVDIGTGRTAIDIAGGDQHFCVILDDTSTRCWGGNTNGVLAIGNTNHIGDTSGEMGDNLIPIDFGTNRSALKMRLGKLTSCFILDNGDVKCSGENGNGRLGYGSSQNIGDNSSELGDNWQALNLGTGRSVKEIGVGVFNNFTCFILDDDSLKCFGANDYGQLGQGNSAIGDEPGEMGANLPVLDLGTGVKAKNLYSGGHHSCIIDSFDRVKCWGRNLAGSLGLGSFSAYGDTADEVGDNLPFVNLGTGRTAKKLALGEVHTCALLDNNDVKCWGEGANGRLGYENSNDLGTSPTHMTNLQAIDFGSDRYAVDISAGYYHTCALLDNGDTKCFGAGSRGALVDERATNVGDDSGEMGDNLPAINVGSNLNVTAMSLGARRSCFILSDNTVKCWGSNHSGQLGLGFGASSAPNDYIGNQLGETGDFVPSLNFGSNLDVAMIAVGGTTGENAGYTCTLFTNGKLKCFGRETDYNFKAAPLGQENNFMYGNEPGEMGDNLPFVSLGSDINAVGVYANYLTTCVLFDNEKLKCFGDNNYGTLGLGSNTPIGDDFGEMGDNLAYVDVGDTGGVLGNFAITGITGGSDSVSDSYLGHNEATINWTSSTGATQYKVTIYDDDGISVRCSEQVTVSTSYSFTGCTLTEGSTYYAKVVAEDDSSNTRDGNNSLYLFVVDTTPPSPFNILGITGGVDTLKDDGLADGLYATVNWQTSPDAISYEVTIYQNGGVLVQCPTVIKESSATDHNFSDCLLEDAGFYQVDVVAKDVLGLTTQASNANFIFSVVDSNAPGAFDISGITGGIDSTLDDNLTNGSWATVNWNDTSGENSYNVTIFENDGVTVKCATQSVPFNTTSTVFNNCDLVSGQTYQAKVEALDTFATTEANNSQFPFLVSTSSSSSFNILGVQGNSYDTTSDNSLSGGNEAKVLWETSSGATSYDVTIYNEDQSVTVCETKNTVSTDVLFANCYLKGNTSYVLRVISNNGVESIEANNSPYTFNVVDFPIASLDNPTAVEGDNITYTIFLNKSWTHDVSVEWKVTGLNATAGVDYSKSSGTATITSGNTSTTFSISSIEDSLSELNEKIIVSLHEPSSLTLDSSSIGVGTLVDDDSGVHPVKTNAGNSVSCVSFSDGTSKCFGFTANGRAGVAENHRGDAPGEMGDNLPTVKLPTGTHAVQVANGNYSTCALLDNGNVVCWGERDQGRLGSASSIDIGWKPGQMGDNLTQLTFGVGRRATKISMFTDHACALLDNGSVTCWGEGQYGRLGIGSENDRLLASSAIVDLGTGRTAKDIHAGSGFTCAHLDNDQVRCWGAGSDGRLGIESTTNIGDTPGEMGDNLVDVDLGTGRSVKKLATGAGAACAILDNDLLKCWGSNNRYLLGAGIYYTLDLGDEPGEMGDNLPYVDLGTGRTVKDVVLRSHNTCAILDNDLVKCWGWNDHDGSRGRGESYDGDSASDMGDNLPYTDFGRDGFDNLLPVSKISLGHKSVCALLVNGDYKCLGNNDNGQLGYGNRFSLGTVSSEVGNNLLAVNVGTGRTVVKVSENFDQHQCVILDNNDLKCWGRDINGSFLGALGTQRSMVGMNTGDMSSLSPIDFGTGRSVSELFYDSYYGCAILDNNSVKCFGDLRYRVAGPFVGDYVGKYPDQYGDNLPIVPLPSDKNVLKMAMGGSFTCFMFDDFTLSCIGSNDKARLGLEVSDSFVGGSAGHWGLNMKALNLGTDRKVINVWSAEFHTCALLDNFKIKCFGFDNGEGRLGQGHDTPVGIGNEPGEMGDALAYTNLGSGQHVVDMSLARYNTCALLDNNSVKCWGEADRRENGRESTTPLGDSLSEMGDNLPIVNFGSDIPLKIYGGAYSQHHCALIDSGGNIKSKCWGRGDSGQRGDETGSNIGDPTLISPINFGTSRTPISMSVGEYHTCAILDNGDVKCFGKNYYGEIGQEHDLTIGDDSGEMGDSLPAIGF